MKHPQKASRIKPAGWVRRHFKWIVAAGIAVWCVVFAWLSVGAVRYGPRMKAPAWVAGIREGRLDSNYCISCHKEAGAAWRGSLHQLANHKVDPMYPGAGFDGQTASTHASDYTFHYDFDRGPIIEEKRHGGTTLEHRPAMRIAHGSLRQFLIGDDTGRYQTTEVAWDPRARDWFGVFGDEERNPGEWGSWTGQSMNWNSMCARCHMTAYDKGYDEASDHYNSTWLEQGIGCIQCHGPMTGHEKKSPALEHKRDIPRERERAMQTCASCHARAEDLTASFPPNEKFDDHFRLQLLGGPRYYHADGQILDEDFEWGSFQHSKMAAAGVTCLDCHDPHSGKTRLPADNNALCMQCHAAGNGRNAPVIDPTAHSFHAADNKGNRCVECHMAETTYMQRDPRRDHGFIIPDPILTRDLDIPNSCSRCHRDKPLEWNIDAWEKWYGASSRTEPRRARARAVARAYRGDATVVPELLELIADEKTPGWRASLLDLAGQLAPGGNTVMAAARTGLGDTSAIVRAAAVRLLGADPATRPLVREALKDPIRLVRLDAEWALSETLAPDSPERHELDAYLNVMPENPVALLRRGQDHFRLGRRDAGVADLRRAIKLDPLSAPIPETLGFMLNAMDHPREAAQAFEQTATLSPDDPLPPFYAALAWAAAGDHVRTEAQLRESLRRDPNNGRAWFNLGLLLAQANRVPAALDAFAKGEKAAPADADIPYAAATILLRLNRTDEAIAAARRALAINPGYQPAAQLLRGVESGVGRP